MTVTFSYAMRDMVVIVAINQPGMVTGALCDSDGVQYRVVYWYDGQRRSEWMHEVELASR